MDISVIGCGRWGGFIGWYLNSIGHNVTIYAPKGNAYAEKVYATRSTGYVTFPKEVTITNNREEATKNDVIIVSIPSQNLRSLMKELRADGVKNKFFVLCMKGLEIGTGKRLTEIVAEEADPLSRTAVWIGPGHVQEFTRGVPNCMVIDSVNKKDKEYLIDEFSSDLIRFYYGDDLIGNEVGAAAKNVVGIAAGMLDGYDLTSLKGPLMSRGTREYARLMKALGGNELSAYGLCHLGDYEATVFSQHSHNRRFGEMYVRVEKFESLAEGYYTVKALMVLAEKTGVELPISNAVYNILYKEEDAKIELNKLFKRSLKTEFYSA